MESRVERHIGGQEQTNGFPEDPRSVLPNTRLTFREATLEDDATGDVYTIGEGSRPESRTVIAKRANTSMTVIAETIAPVFQPMHHSPAWVPPSETTRQGIQLIKTPAITPQSRARRIEEHRERVRLVRAQMGNPNEALNQFLASFDPDALRVIAHDFADEELAGDLNGDQCDDATDE